MILGNFSTRTTSALFSEYHLILLFQVAIHNKLVDIHVESLNFYCAYTCDFFLFTDQFSSFIE